MQLGNASWGFRQIPLVKQLAITRAMGLETLELGIAGHKNDFLQLNATSAQIDQARNWFRQYNIKLLCASTGNDFTQVDSRDSATVKRAINIAAQLGIRYLRIFAGFSPIDEVTGKRWDKMVTLLNEVVTFARQHNVIAALETHGGVEPYLDGIRHFDSITTIAACWKRLADEVVAPFGVVFDPANLGAVGMDEKQILDLYSKLPVSYLHLKDFKETPQGALTPCACGEGRLNWRILWDELKNFIGPAMIEYELTEDIEDGLKRSQEYLQKI